MTRRTFLQAAAAKAAEPKRPSAKRPNVLFFLTDQWRAQATGYNRDPNAHTPALDRFERQSVNFQYAVSGTPVCCPYRASIMTGQYPLRHGVFINDVELRPTGPTLAEVFAQNGYRAGYIGKWHLHGSPDGKYGRRTAFVPPDKRLGFDYWKAFEVSHSYNQSGYYEGNDPELKYWPGYDALAQTADACRFIERQTQSSDPYFLMLSVGPPHDPYDTAPAKYKSMYQSRQIQLRPNVPPQLREKAQSILRGYYSHIAALDDCLDQLLSTLDRTGTASDTIVVFTSDHGDMMLSQGLTTKLYPWDESIRIPFLFRYPARFGNQSRRLKTPLNAPDVMPTLLGACGLPVPASVEGTDFLNAPDGQNAAALLSLPVPSHEARRYGFAEYRGLRTPRYTYVRSIGGPWLLDDNHRDPFQKPNLANMREARTLQSELDRQLTDKLKDVHDEFLPAAEYVRRASVGHYREVNVPIGTTRSPWGDWESTLKPGPKSAQDVQ